MVITKIFGGELKTFITKTHSFPNLTKDTKFENSSDFQKIITPTINRDNNLVEAECNSSYCLLLFLSESKDTGRVVLSKILSEEMVAELKIDKLSSFRWSKCEQMINIVYRRKDSDVSEADKFYLRQLTFDIKTFTSNKNKRFLYS